MNGKFIVYALVVSLVCTALSWRALLAGPHAGEGSYRSNTGSSWSSNSGYGGGSWGGGGHK